MDAAESNERIVVVEEKLLILLREYCLEAK